MVFKTSNLILWPHGGSRNKTFGRWARLPLDMVMDVRLLKSHFESSVLAFSPLQFWFKNSGCDEERDVGSYKLRWKVCTQVKLESCLPTDV